MARMLQALKNLEARSAWPAAGGSVLSHLAAAPAPTPESLNVPEAAPAAAPADEPLDEPPGRTAATLSALVLPALASAPVAEAPSRAGTRPATGLERAVRRTLSEPHRRQPLAEIATRLRQDAHQTGSRTLLFTGIGPESATHETSLHVAALLADEGGKVLLVDADLARRQLSTELDDLPEPGLSDLADEGVLTTSLLQPTAFENLAFLPAGSRRFADLANAASPLARAFGPLAADYDLVILDGGRTGDPTLPTLARLCDATYVVVQLGAVEATYAQQALRELRAAGARVLGCIATGDQS